jgi:hypothetical protein
LKQAVARRAFARGFRREVKADAALVDLTDRLLEKAALDSLAMAFKARRVLPGFAKVEAAIAHEPVVRMLHAADAGRDGVRKLDAALRHRAEDGSGAVPVDATFTSAQLDLALGRPNVIHAALLAGPESEAFAARLARLTRFRTGGLPAGAAERSKSPEEQDRNG